MLGCFRFQSIFLLCCILLLQSSAGVAAFQFPSSEKMPRTRMKSSPSNQGTNESYSVQTRNPLRLLVLRLGLTELAWTSPLNYQKKEGTYDCAYCGQKLFDTTSKYDSRSGWPSFWRTIEEEALSYKMEMDGRLECQCGRCSSHLGHVFLDGPRQTDVPQELLEASPASDPRSKRENARLPRFCINGASLKVDEKASSSTN